MRLTFKFRLAYANSIRLYSKNPLLSIPFFAVFLFCLFLPLNKILKKDICVFCARRYMGRAIRLCPLYYSVTWQERVRSIVPATYIALLARLNIRRIFKCLELRIKLAPAPTTATAAAAINIFLPIISSEKLFYRDYGRKKGTVFRRKLQILGAIRFL